MKQVLIIHYTLPPVVGGVETLLKPFSELFAKKGYLVTLLAGEGKIEDHNIKTSIVPEFSPNHSAIRNIQRVLKLGSLPENYEYRLSQIQRKVEAEIGNIQNIIIHNVMTMPNNLILTEALFNFIEKNPGKKFYIWVHDLAWAMDEYRSRLYNRRPWVLLKEALTSPNIKYITISEVRRRQMVEIMGLSKKDIIVVPNMIDYADFYKFCDETHGILERVDIRTRFPFIVSPVRFLVRKNIERSIEIIESIKLTYPDVILLITGLVIDDDSEEYYREIKKLVNKKGMNENVLFLNDLMKELNISPEKNNMIVRDLYFAGDLVLITSKDEGFGMTILEGGLARIPIASSDLQVFKEITKDGVIYLPFNESPVYNANRILKFLEHNQNRISNFHDKIIRNYSFDYYWENYLSFLFS
ncbi:MAG: glycosyltransferase family 4 protein [Candidatus Marinimicrobia bacterium]|nr:glycosyltransferase family 4 protein [Candidatus Neomarinimicrobiota bacterium]